MSLMMSHVTYSRCCSAKTLNTFCDVIGVARRGGEVWTAVNVLEQCCREELDAEAQRRFVVVDPVKVTLTNVAADFVEHVMLPNNPRDDSAGKRSVALCNTVFLERSDFREEGADDRDFYGLAPGKTVMLRCVSSVPAASPSPALVSCRLAVTRSTSRARA
jgi:glutaminyl-tRNA synthetase